MNNNYNSLKLVIFGAGRWGKNHIKTAASLLPNENITVVDLNPSTGELVNSISDKIDFTSNFEHSALDFNIAIVATPAETHYQLAKDLLNSGKHVLVEKPITLRADEAGELEELSIKKNLKLMVGHVLLYHPAIIEMKKKIQNGLIGDLQYIYSNRLNLGAIRSEENSLWSFAPHDISIIQSIVNDNPTSIHAHGGDFIQNGIEDTTLTFLTYPNNIKAHIFVSWLHPFKEQRLVVIGDKGMIVFEDSLKTNKLKFYKKGFEVKNGTVEKFDSEFEVVDFNSDKQPLSEEHRHFYDSVLNDTQPLTDGKHAAEVLKILEEATKSLKN
ncbi:MAG: Gfo/Idh/MocA family oxidoreductase [Melioribacteraceae bacterium]|nr:Gfo/Idh/MocA family oxidoreductase [Melioribacteraceae bacterium]MCF8266110.1 Gfo/Idh/MocA family oxidoreductase [Melioribacteraceae bacterium]MCF8431500.1 Gfo/Idh/MocA family oxidoreductase [Melioribacteraceae bacterium]